MKKLCEKGMDGFDYLFFMWLFNLAAPNKIQTWQWIFFWVIAILSSGLHAYNHTQSKD